MNFRKYISLALVVVLCLSALSYAYIPAIASADAISFDMSEIWPHSTQFQHEKSNPSWMSDFKVGEKPGLIDMLMNRNILIPKPTGYPYIHTPETFKKEVDQYMQIYKLDESSYRASYIYTLELLNKFSSALYADASDEHIKEWLEAYGIVYPENGLEEDETIILARALYTVLKSNSKFAETIPSSYKLEAAIIAYISHAFETDLSELKKWDKDANLDTLHKYIIAISKVGLHARGYDINANTSDETVYKLTAVMLIETAGYAIDIENASLEELQLKYLSAMLSKAYDVTLSPNLLDKAIKEDRLAFYILQAMGQANNIAIKSNLNYNDAFDIIATKTTNFDLKQDKFYSDVYNYEVYLEYLRDAIWIWPKSIMKTIESDNQKVDIIINGRVVKDDMAGKVALNPKMKYQTIEINVVFTKGEETVKSTYKLKVYQGEIEAPDENAGNKEKEEPITFPVFDAINELFTRPKKQTGSNPEISMPSRIKSIMSMFSPDFGNEKDKSPFEFLTNLLDFSPDNFKNDYKDDKSGLGGIGGADIGYTPIYNQNSYFANSGSDSPLAYGAVAQYQNVNSQKTQATPYKHIAELEPAPQGYTYITDSRGYVLGLAMKYDSSAPAINANLNLNESKTFENILPNLKWFSIPIFISLLGIAIILVWRRKNKQPVN